MCCQVTTQTHVSLQVTPRPWEAPSTPPARFQLAAHPRAHRCRLGPEGPRWMVPTRRLWGSRTGAQHPSTRTSCTSSERRSWPTRCWPGGSPCPTTCRWPCRASGRCPGCSHRCQLYLHPPCLQQGPGPALDQHLQITAGLMVGPSAPGTWDGEGSQSQQIGMWTCALAGLGSAVHWLPWHRGCCCDKWCFSSSLVYSGAHTKGLLVGCVPWSQGSPWWGQGAGLGAGINTGHVLFSGLFLPACRYGRAQHAPSRTLRRASWDARPAPRRASQALA